MRSRRAALAACGQAAPSTPVVVTQVVEKQVTSVVTQVVQGDARYANIDPFGIRRRMPDDPSGNRARSDDFLI